MVVEVCKEKGGAKPVRFAGIKRDVRAAEALEID
jgi:hypothetical protein